MNFWERLKLGVVYFFDPIWSFIGWIIWIISGIDITYGYKAYKDKLTREMFKNGKNVF